VIIVQELLLLLLELFLFYLVGSDSFGQVVLLLGEELLTVVLKGDLNFDLS
jgi:hypothetical protein